MFDDVLIESAGKDRTKGGWITALISAVIHIGVVGGLIAAGYYVKENPEVIEKPMSAFIVASAPPPPPPPPPPPASSNTVQSRPRVETPREETPREQFRQPTETPQNVPQVADVPSEDEDRSEEHTSELQSQSNLVCRLLLEKKKYSPTQRRTTP